MKLWKLEIVTHKGSRERTKWEFEPTDSSIFLISLVFTRTVLFVLGFWRLT